MSLPHSVVHARSYVDEVEKSPVQPAKSKAEPGVKGMVSLSERVGRQFFAAADTFKNQPISKKTPVCFVVGFLLAES